VATTPGPDVVFDEATPTDATATAPDGGTPTTSPAAPAPTTPTSGAHRLIPGSQSSAPTVPPGAANTRASAPPTPRGATPQQPTPGPPVQSSSAAAPPPATPATPATPAVPGTVNLAARSQVNAAGYLQNYFPTNVVDENIDSYWEAQPGFPQNLTIDLGSVHGIGRIELYLPNQPNWNSRNETIEILGSGTNPAGTDFTILGSHDYHFDANDPNNRDHVSVSFAPAKTRWITLRFTANSGWPDAQLSEIQVY
jgi:hypothetical protein